MHDMQHQHSWHVEMELQYDLKNWHLINPKFCLSWMQFAGRKKERRKKKKVLLQGCLSLYVFPERALEGPQDYWLLSPARQAPRFPHGWPETSDSPGYPHYDWVVGCSGYQALGRLPIECYSGLRQVNLVVPMGSRLSPRVEATLAFTGDVCAINIVADMQILNGTALQNDLKKWHRPNKPQILLKLDAFTGDIWYATSSTFLMTCRTWMELYCIAVQNYLRDLIKHKFFFELHAFTGNVWYETSPLNLMTCRSGKEWNCIALH